MSLHVCMCEGGGGDACIYQQMHTDTRLDLTAKYPPFGKLNNTAVSNRFSLPCLSKGFQLIFQHLKSVPQLSSNDETLQDSLCCFYPLWLFI